MARRSDLRVVYTSHFLREAWSQLTPNLDRFGPVLTLVVMLVVFSSFNSHFGRLNNLMLIALEAATIGIVAAGQTFVILTGGVDLSVGSLVGLTGVIAAGLMKWGAGPLPPLNPYAALLVGLGLGVLAGLFHGLMITRTGIPPFILTLGTLSAFRGLALVYSKATPIHLLPEDFKWIADGYVAGIPIPVLVVIFIYAVAWYILNNTTLGRYIYAMGGNESATRLLGVNVDIWKLYVYAISGLLSALAGMLLIARLDSGIYTNGEGYELAAIAGVVIGGARLSGGVGAIWGSLVGVLIMTTIQNALVLYSVPPEWNSVVTGSVIVLAVLLDVWRKDASKAS